MIIQNKPKVAFITGISGQDSSYLAEFLLNKGYKVVGMKRRTSSISTERLNHIYDHPNFHLVYGNMSDSTSLWRLLKEHQPDEIYNLAAMSHVRVSFEVPEEAVDIAGMGALRLLNAYKELCPKAKFYQASSSEMYGDNPEIPQSELTRMTPASPYAAGKLLAHNIVRNYRLSYGLHASSGILFNHESPRRGETFVTRKITIGAAKILLGLQDKLYLGNLEAKRDWGYAGDYVEAMWLMLQQENPDDYVIATGETHTVREFLEEVFNCAGLSIDKHVGIDQRLFRPHEVPVLLGDATKANTVLNWKPKVGFKELAKMMFKADYDHIKNQIK
jgi:GDPmannose 4,6-dehydratase